MEVKKA